MEFQKDLKSLLKRLTFLSQRFYCFASDLLSCRLTHCVECVQIRSYSGPYFLVFRLNMEIYSVNLRIQSECRKIQTRKNSVLGHFSRSDSSTEPSHNFISLLFSIWMPLTIVITSTITTLSLSIAKYTQGWIQNPVKYLGWSFFGVAKY